MLTYGEALADRIVSYRDILCDIVSYVSFSLMAVSLRTLLALRTAAAWNKGFSFNIVYVRHLRLLVYAWFSTGIQAVRGWCRRLLFSEIWSDVVRCSLMR